MKIRFGWVSNSSSSSFLIAWRNGELEDLVAKALRIPEKNPLSGFVKSISRFISESGDRIIEHSDIKRYAEDHYLKDDDPDLKKIKSLLKRGFKIREGCWSNDNGNELEDWLSDNDLNVKNKDLIIEHNGGY
jgi:hypothetical protein